MGFHVSFQEYTLRRGGTEVRHPGQKQDARTEGIRNLMGPRPKEGCQTGSGGSIGSNKSHYIGLCLASGRRGSVSKGFELFRACS